MAQCTTCGKLTFGGTLCNDCKVRLTTKEKIIRQLQAGNTIYLYETVYSSVGSIVNEQTIGGEFEISTVRKLGLDGWEVIQAIPRTTGIGLANHAIGFSGGESWGGGIGGNVIGVYMILKKELKNMDDLNQWGKLDSYIQNHIDEFAT